MTRTHTQVHLHTPTEGHTRAITHRYTHSQRKHPQGNYTQACECTHRPTGDTRIPDAHAHRGHTHLHTDAHRGHTHTCTETHTGGTHIPARSRKQASSSFPRQPLDLSLSQGLWQGIPGRSYNNNIPAMRLEHDDLSSVRISPW